MTTVTMTQLEPRPGCIQAALDIIGDKWTALILRDLSTGPKRFTQLESSLSGISPRTLAQRLVKLEATHVVFKRPLPQPVGHCEYALTPKGCDFAGILQQMAEWGEKYA